MNIALPTLILLFLIIPGIVARYWYRRGSWPSPVQFTTATEEIISGIIWAIPIHYCWHLISNKALQISIDLDVLILLLLGQANIEIDKVRHSLTSISDNSLPIFIYLFGINIFAGLCGLAGNYEI